jgi:hypothetical protein
MAWKFSHFAGAVLFLQNLTVSRYRPSDVMLPPVVGRRQLVRHDAVIQRSPPWLFEVWLGISGAAARSRFQGEKADSDPPARVPLGL